MVAVSVAALVFIVIGRQLFGRLWVRLSLPTGQFSEIEFSADNVVSVLRDVKQGGAASAGLETVAGS